MHFVDIAASAGAKSTLCTAEVRFVDIANRAGAKSTFCTGVRLHVVARGKRIGRSRRA